MIHSGGYLQLARQKLKGEKVATVAWDMVVEEKGIVYVMYPVCSFSFE